MPNTAIITQYTTKNIQQKQNTIKMDAQAVFIQKMTIKKQRELCTITRSNLGM